MVKELRQCGRRPTHFLCLRLSSDFVESDFNVASTCRREFGSRVHVPNRVYLNSDANPIESGGAKHRRSTSRKGISNTDRTERIARSSSLH